MTSVYQDVIYHPGYQFLVVFEYLRVNIRLLGYRRFAVLWSKMAVSSAVVSMVRILAIIHIVVGALLIIFGIADGVTTVLGAYTFAAGYGFYGVWIGTWVSVHVEIISAFVRYKLTYFSPSQPFCFLAFLPARQAYGTATWNLFVKLKGRLHDRAKMARIRQKLERFQQFLQRNSELLSVPCRVHRRLWTKV